MQVNNQLFAYRVVDLKRVQDVGVPSICLKEEAVSELGFATLGIREKQF